MDHSSNWFKNPLSNAAKNSEECLLNLEVAALKLREALDFLNSPLPMQEDEPPSDSVESQLQNPQLASCTAMGVQESTDLHGSFGSTINADTNLRQLYASQSSQVSNVSSAAPRMPVVQLLDCSPHLPKERVSSAVSSSYLNTIPQLATKFESMNLLIKMDIDEAGLEAEVLASFRQLAHTEQLKILNRLDVVKAELRKAMPQDSLQITPVTSIKTKAKGTNNKLIGIPSGCFASMFFGS